MADSSEIINNDKKNLSNLMAIEALGGDIKAAIASAKASMNKEDVDAVTAEIEAYKRSIGK
ncbi:MAG: hypothetical protein FWG83_01785 [Oscillospiraceae bacterium]|nr:hypothetical protein [Oscillospiraceae bacterium]